MEATPPAAEDAANTSESNVIKIKVKTLGQASYDLEVESDVSTARPLQTCRFHDSTNRLQSC